MEGLREDDGDVSSVKWVLEDGGGERSGGEMLGGSGSAGLGLGEGWSS